MESFRQGDYQLVLEPTFCKGCSLCVNTCPTNILYLTERGKIAVRPEDVAEKCIFCGLCEQRCPDFAIWIVKPRREALVGAPVPQPA
jgi:2-oxoglutarate ferredoxin oxidoreductase subunit delta